MIRLTLTEEQQQIVREASEPIEVVDSDGNVLTMIGHGFTQTDLDEAVAAARSQKPVGSLKRLLERLKESTPRSAGE